MDVSSVLFSGYNEIKNLVSNTHCEVGAAVVEYFIDKKVTQIDADLDERIKLGRSLLNGELPEDLDIADNSFLPEKVKKVWREVKENPEGAIRRARWIQVLTTGVRTLPLLGYTVVCSSVLGLSSLGAVSVCILTPIFSKTAFVLLEELGYADPLEEPTQKFLKLGLEALTVAIVVIKQISPMGNTDQLLSKMFPYLFFYSSLRVLKVFEPEELKLGPFAFLSIFSTFLGITSERIRHGLEGVALFLFCAVFIQTLPQWLIRKFASDSTEKETVDSIFQKFEREVIELYPGESEKEFKAFLAERKKEIKDFLLEENVTKLCQQYGGVCITTTGNSEAEKSIQKEIADSIKKLRKHFVWNIIFTQISNFESKIGDEINKLTDGKEKETLQASFRESELQQIMNRAAFDVNAKMELQEALDAEDERTIQEWMVNRKLWSEIRPRHSRQDDYSWLLRKVAHLKQHKDSPDLVTIAFKIFKESPYKLTKETDRALAREVYSLFKARDEEG